MRKYGRIVALCVSIITGLVSLLIGLGLIWDTYNVLASVDRDLTRHILMEAMSPGLLLGLIGLGVGLVLLSIGKGTFRKYVIGAILLNLLGLTSVVLSRVLLRVRRIGHPRSTG